jgi:hypothetical protein
MSAPVALLLIVRGLFRVKLYLAADDLYDL